MAAPAAVLAAKAVLAAATDKRGRTAIATVVAAVLTPFILIIVMILCALSGTAGHNNAAVDLAFNGGYLSAGLPADYRMYIEKMQESFRKLDAVLAEINGMAEDGTVDGYRVKAVFYALFFGAEQPRMNDDDYRGFADCFVTYEEREDEEGETYMVAVPITDMGTVYGNLSSLLGRGITDEDRANAQRIYVLAKYGQAGPGSGLPPGEAMGDGSFAALIAEGEKYLGYGIYQTLQKGTGPEQLEDAFDGDGLLLAGIAVRIMEKCGRELGREAAPGQIIDNLCSRYRPHKDRGNLKSRLTDMQDAFESVMACFAGTGPGTDEEKETLVKKCVGLTMECIRAHIFVAGKLQAQKQEGGMAQICSQS